MVGRRKSGGGYYVDVIQKRERMLHLLKRLPRKIAVSRMATSLVLARLPSATAAGFYTAVIIIVSVPLQQAFELRRVYIQFVSRNYNLSGIGARRCGRNREQPLSAYLATVDTIVLSHWIAFCRLIFIGENSLGQIKLVIEFRFTIFVLRTLIRENIRILVETFHEYITGVVGNSLKFH